MADIDTPDRPLPDADMQEEDMQEEEEAFSSSDHEPSMVVARSRRANAGNRMSTLLQLAVEEDTQTPEGYEIFQETADDVDFDEPDDGEDADENVQDSTDEEDEEEGPQDEEQGEKELRKAERQKSLKRKRGSGIHEALKHASAKMARPTAIFPLSTRENAPPRPKKKSERVSWLPVKEEAPKRQSSRGLAVQNKQVVHERLKTNEERRLRTVAIMQAVEKRKEASRPKVLTQADRLEEAAKTERLNSKSLNSWEIAEKKRAEEQAARIAALKSRKLEGPIISYWSGPSLWVNGKLKKTGKVVVDKDSWVEESERENEDVPAASTPVVHAAATPSVQAEESTVPSTSVHSHRSTPTATEQTVVAKDIQTATSECVVQGHDDQPFDLSTSNSSLMMPTLKDHVEIGETATPMGPVNFMDQVHYFANLPTEAQKQATPAQVPRPQHREIAARILIELREFGPDLKLKDRDAYMHHLCDWPSAQPKKLLPAKKTPCIITGQSARYCDPATGFAYVDITALKSIRRLMANGCQWSTLLGLYTGPTNKPGNEGAVYARPAAGVPDKFWKQSEAVARREATKAVPEVIIL